MPEENYKGSETEKLIDKGGSGIPLFVSIMFAFAAYFAYELYVKTPEKIQDLQTDLSYYQSVEEWNQKLQNPHDGMKLKKRYDGSVHVEIEEGGAFDQWYLAQALKRLESEHGLTPQGYQKAINDLKACQAMQTASKIVGAK